MIRADSWPGRIIAALGRRPQPQKVYEFTFALYGRDVAIVTVPGASEDEAALFAGKYLAANLYPRVGGEVDKPLPLGGRGIDLPARTA